MVMQKMLSDSSITVPVPDHAELRTGTLQSIIRQSRIPRSEFELRAAGSNMASISLVPKCNLETS